jgi:hypothetical protein
VGALTRNEKVVVMLRGGSKTVAMADTLWLTSKD